jgi:hypothetical protein
MSPVEVAAIPAVLLVVLILEAKLDLNPPRVIFLKGAIFNLDLFYIL